MGLSNLSVWGIRTTQLKSGNQSHAELVMKHRQDLQIIEIHVYYLWHIISKGTLRVPLTKSRFELTAQEEILSFEMIPNCENWTDSLDDIIQKSTFILIIFKIFCQLILSISQYVPCQP